MNIISNIRDSSERYARCIESSKRVRWDIEKDVIRGRHFDAAHKFLPDGLALADAFTTLSVDEKRFVSQIQGRTYANVFGLVERFINAKVLELSEDHWFGDQVALEALVRFSDEELKHQALFRRVDAMVGDVLPEGYSFDVDHNAVARVVLGKSTWAVLALTLDIELLTQLHYRQSIDPDHRTLRAVQGRVLVSLEGGKPARHPGRTRVGAPRRGANAGETRSRRSTSSSSWSRRWTASCSLRPKPMRVISPRPAAARSSEAEARAIEAAFLKAYRWQYIHSGAQHPQFGKVLSSLITENQGQRIQSALATLH